MLVALGDSVAQAAQPVRGAYVALGGYLVFGVQQARRVRRASKVSGVAPVRQEHVEHQALLGPKALPALAVGLPGPQAPLAPQVLRGLRVYLRPTGVLLRVEPYKK